MPTSQLRFHLFPRLIIFNLFLFSSYSLDNLGGYPVHLSANFRSGYYSIKMHSRLYFAGAERIKVYDDFECMQECSRLGNNCKSINYNTNPDGNGMHVCEIYLVNEEGEVAQVGQSSSFTHLALESPILQSCVDIHANGGKNSGVFSINPPFYISPMYIYCDMCTNGGGWTIIQRRLDGSVNFYRVWDEFKKGFGDKLGEYWLGLEMIHLMTSRANYTLRIELEDFYGKRRHAQYERFYIADEKDNYRIAVGRYSGTAGDSLTSHSGAQFSTKDRDNDIDSATSCAVAFKGAWWHTNCHFGNLNGEYAKSLNHRPSKLGAGIVWSSWKSWEPLKKAEMKIRPIHY